MLVVHIEPCNIAARRHDCTHPAVGKLEYTLHDLLLSRFEHPSLGTHSDQPADSVRRHGRFVRVAHRKTLSSASVEKLRIATRGAPILDSSDVGPATAAAIRSGLCKAKRFGTSSPTIRDK